MYFYRFGKKVAFITSFNPYVKAFIVSEVLIWSAWSFIGPLFAIFVTEKVSGGSIQVATSALSFYFIIRILCELGVSRFIHQINEHKKITIILLGMSLVTVSNIGFGLTTSVFPLYLCWLIAGVGWGISSPIKYALFSRHLDKNRETTEWGVYDAATFAFMAIATAAGGFMANQFGFFTLFLAAAIVNTIGTIPFLLYARKNG